MTQWTQSTFGGADMNRLADLLDDETSKETPWKKYIRNQGDEHEHDDIKIDALKETENDVFVGLNNKKLNLISLGPICFFGNSGNSQLAHAIMDRSAEADGGEGRFIIDTIITESMRTVVSVANHASILSDRNIKKNIKPLNIDINIIEKMEPVSFNYINDNKESLGFIAQDIQKLCPTIINQTKDGVLSINYNEMFPILVKYIQDINNRITILEQKMDIVIPYEKTKIYENQNVKKPYLQDKIIKNFNLTFEFIIAFFTRLFNLHKNMN